jgi:NAD(P)-dependent dehydrogenase (short-subunit alcohol dehydrogenase family)
VGCHIADPSDLQAAGGIGEETAYAFAEAGAVGVIVADINEQGAQKSAERSKKFAKHPEYRAVTVQVDITDEASVQAMVDRAIKEFRRIDYCVNSAGVCA